MFVYTTCRDCGGLLHVTNSDTVHPGCTPAPTKVERLSWQWRDAVLADNPHLEARLDSQIKDLEDRPPRLLDAAVQYAEWGWPVFPLRGVGTRCDGGEKCKRAGICQCPKKPATRHGLNDATTDTTRVAAWWTTHPDHNIGIATGHAFDVIDIDPPEGTISYLELLRKEDPQTGRGQIPDCHGQVATASGGIHLYINATGKGNTTRIRPGIDYRGQGGYVVAPPSTLGEPGRSWSWTVKPSPVITGVGDVHA